MIVRATFFVTLATVGLVTGFLFGMALVELAFYNLTAEQFIVTQQIIDRQISAVMPLVMVLAIVAGCAALVSMRQVAGSRSFILLALGTICSLLVMVSTSINNAPINQEIQTWSAVAPPTNWADIRDTWFTWHIVRTVLSAIALVSHLLAVLLLVHPSSLMSPRASVMPPVHSERNA